MHSRSSLVGVLSGLGAGLVWGLVFLAPQILYEYPPTLLAFGRYLAFGLICLPLAWRDRHQLAQLDRHDWFAALALSTIGNILYYLFLAAAIQIAGGALPTLIIGTLPIVIALVANAGNPTALPWPRLLPSLLLISAGILLVHQFDLPDSEDIPRNIWSGLALAVLALSCWTWYPLFNARWLKQRPGLTSGTWATAQGLATLPLSLAGMGATSLWLARQGEFTFPLGPRPMLYIGIMLALGLLASWLGTMLWNQASRLLPTALTGQLIVFETLAALAYTYAWIGKLPDLPTAGGILLLFCGVLLGLHSFRQSGHTNT